MSATLELRYGMNPHQQPAWLAADNDSMPLDVLNGTPGYINLMDALNGWQLVRELKHTLNLPAAASFKHVSPAGAAIGTPLNDVLRQAYFVGSLELSPLASAYARARGADRISSFGDWIALSDIVDYSTAKLIQQEVSDGVIAPGYEPNALKLLKSKKKGAYRIIQIDPEYEPPEMETRDIFGLTLKQKRDVDIPSESNLDHAVSTNKHISEGNKRDMLLALIALRYTQSNSVCFTLGGQVIGMGAGQQSRIHCTRLAADKADNWFLRQHPRVLELPFREGINRTARDNAIDQYLLPYLSAAEERAWLSNFHKAPRRLSKQEKRNWLNNLQGVTLGSDAFFPFRDSIDRARASGVDFVVQPGGSIRDHSVTSACNEYGMVMVLTGTRMFHH